MARNRKSQHITLTELRGNLYQLIDQAIETGIPLEIERKGHHLRIVPEAMPLKMNRLTRREDIIANPDDDLIHTDWVAEWKPLV